MAFNGGRGFYGDGRLIEQLCGGSCWRLFELVVPCGESFGGVLGWGSPQSGQLCGGSFLGYLLAVPYVVRRTSLARQLPFDGRALTLLVHAEMDKGNSPFGEECSGGGRAHCTIRCTLLASNCGVLPGWAINLPTDGQSSWAIICWSTDIFRGRLDHFDISSPFFCPATLHRGPLKMFGRLVVLVEW